jgi:hypothetical protein
MGWDLLLTHLALAMAGGGRAHKPHPPTSAHGCNPTRGAGALSLSREGGLGLGDRALAGPPPTGSTGDNQRGEGPSPPRPGPDN